MASTRSFQELASSSICSSPELCQCAVACEVSAAVPLSPGRYALQTGMAHATMAQDILCTGQVASVTKHGCWDCCEWPCIARARCTYMYRPQAVYTRTTAELKVVRRHLRAGRLNAYLASVIGGQAALVRLVRCPEAWIALRHVQQAHPERVHIHCGRVGQHLVAAGDGGQLWRPEALSAEGTLCRCATDVSVCTRFGPALTAYAPSPGKQRMWRPARRDTSSYREHTVTVGLLASVAPPVRSSGCAS